MSVIQNPLIGRAKQKLGGSVFTTWKGINVLKGKPLTVANPRTDNQVMRRSALEQIVAIGRTIAAAINLGFKEQAFQKSAFNAFVGYNLRNGFDYSAPPNAAIVPDNVLVSQGTISATPIIGIAAVASTDLVTATFSTVVTGPGQSTSDNARAVIYNQTEDKWFAPVTTSLRSTGTLAAAVPDGFMTAGDLVKCYLFFYNTASRKSSDSVFADVTVN